MKIKAVLKMPIDPLAFEALFGANTTTYGCKMQSQKLSGPNKMQSIDLNARHCNCIMVVKCGAKSQAPAIGLYDHRQLPNPLGALVTRRGPVGPFVGQDRQQIFVNLCFLAHLYLAVSIVPSVLQFRKAKMRFSIKLQKVFHLKMHFGTNGNLKIWVRGYIF